MMVSASLSEYDGKCGYEWIWLQVRVWVNMILSVSMSEYDYKCEYEWIWL